MKDEKINLNKNNIIYISCYKNNEFIVTKDCSRSMAEFLIENNLVHSKSIETIARGIRKSSKNGNIYHGFTFIRHNESKYNYLENGNVDIIQNGIILSTHKTSKDCAKWLLNNNLVENTSINTLSRGIRKAIKNNKPYHKFIFKRNNNF